MDLRQIEYIVAIEQEQSISKAAEKLYLTQSALNQQLLRLEKELGTPLFERRKHSHDSHPCGPHLPGHGPPHGGHETGDL